MRIAQSMARVVAAVCTMTFVAALSTTPHAFAAENWYPSKYGADDTIGAANNLSADKVLEAAKLIKLGKAYALGVETGPSSPAYPPRRYGVLVLGSPPATMGSNEATGNDDFLTTFVGVGSQLDGLGHMGINHVYYNGNKATDFVQVSGLTKLGTHAIPPIVSRGVLLDMAKHYGENPVPAGRVFNRAEIDAVAKAQGVTIGKGDVVLFHTGWLNLAGVDDAKFMAGEPGLGVEGAQYLADLGVVAIGSDCWALEAIPHEDPKQAFPVHVTLLAKNGVYILENMDTRQLAADGGHEFLFVLGQARFVGTVQAVINPIAIR